MSLDVNISEPEEFNCNELHSSIKQAAITKGITDFVYHVDSLCGKGDNFIANLYRVVIKDTNNEENKTNVIVKTLVNNIRQETFRDLHRREVSIYVTVLPTLREIQNVVNEEERIVFPEFVFASAAEGEEILILEDMNVKGFSMSDKVAKFEQLDVNEVELVLKELAKFHALSFVYEHQEPEDFKDCKSEYEDLVFGNKFLNKSRLRTHFLESFEMSLKVIDDAELKKSLKWIGVKLMDILRFYTKPKKHSVLCHGDFWINNILFKKLELDHQLCFLDFQALRYANPLTDIFHFLFLSTNSNFRFQHLDSLLDIYYESLCKFSNLFKIDANLIYPREDFESDIKNMLPYGLLIALLELRIVTCTAEDIDHLRGSRDALDVFEQPNNNELFKVRVNDTVREAMRNGSINKLLDELNESVF